MDSIATLFLVIALFITMLGMGLALTVSDFKRIGQYPGAVLLGLVNQLICLPLIGFLLAVGLQLPPAIAIGIMILAACPGGPTSNLISYLAKGDIALSVTLTAASSVITFLTIPFVINLSLEHFYGQGEAIRLDAVQTILQLLVVTVIPISIGMVIRKKNAAFAVRMDRPVRILSVVVLAIVIIAIAVKERENIVPYFRQAGLAALFLNAGTMVLGYASAKLFRLTNARAVTISIESGIQNGTLAIAIATGMLMNTQFAIAPAVYSLIMFLTGGIIIALAQRIRS